MNTCFRIRKEKIGKTSRKKNREYLDREDVT